MRILSAFVACAMLAGCISHPAPNQASIKFMQTQGYGGFIEVERRDGTLLRGELLAVEGDLLWVLDTRNQTVSVDLHDVRGAALWTYESDWGFGIWGLLGSLSTASHGFFLVLSFPIWVLASSLTAMAESRHVRIRFPEEDIDSFYKWARYPQGMPAARGPTKQAQAWALTKRAQEAARAGTCKTVIAFEPRVRELDAQLYELTFLRDEAIRRCLNLPSLLPTAPGAPDAGVPMPDAGVPMPDSGAP